MRTGWEFEGFKRGLMFQHLLRLLSEMIIDALFDSQKP